MSSNITYNELVIKFANVNGSGSASANTFCAKSLYRMGIPISAKNKIITIKKAVRRLTELMNTMDTYGVSPT